MDNTADLWIDFEPSPVPVPPPIRTRAQVLPFEQLAWEDFERLCFRLALRSGNVADCRRYGVAGQEQQGIDIYVRCATDGGYATWQSKRHTSFSASELRTSVEKFLAGEWSKRSKVFHLAVTVSLSPTALANEVEAQAAECRKRHIEFVPLDVNRLSEMLKAHPDLVDDFFDRPWVEAFCGGEAASALGKRKLTKQQRVEARRQLRDLYSAHFAAVDIGLPAAAAGFRDATPVLPLRRRYVDPLVEAVSSIIERVEDALSGTTGGGVAGSAPTRRAQRSVGFRAKEQRIKLQLFEWLDTVQHGVLLGGPGFGKSTTLRFLALDLLSVAPRSEALARKWGKHLPLFLPFALLTRLVAEQELISVPDFLRGWLRKLSAPPAMIALFDDALEDERLVLLLDGLDEWTDETAAATALVKVLAFAIPRRLPIIASARPLGYQRLGGLGPEWKRAHLLPFEAKQQRDFTRIWFEHFYTATLPAGGAASSAAAPASRETDSFMTEVAQDAALADLAGVPLLLSALIFLRLQGRILPRGRFEALSVLAQTLLIEQPQRRARAALQGVTPSAHHRRLVERGIEYLALRIHQQPASDAIPEDAAREYLAEFYQGSEFRKSPSEAMEMASSQLERAKHEVGILVERHPGHIGFFHRSLQEFLAAKQIVRLPFGELKEFAAKQSGEPGWQEILLAVLHQLQRQDEVDGILETVRAQRADPIALTLRQIFLARAIFADLNSSAAVVDDIATELFDVIEASPWMPLRRALLEEVVRGLDSEVLGARLRERLRAWFPGGAWFRFGLFRPLAEKPILGTDCRLFRALFNSHSIIEQKEIAEAIAAGSQNFPGLADKLCGLLSTAAEVELAVSALHALALGWPDHPELPKLLREASVSPASELRCAGLLHRAKGGDAGQEVKLGLAGFLNWEHRINWWEDEIIDTLARSWPTDHELKSIALDSVVPRGMPATWENHLALRFLVQAWPADNEVAGAVADYLRREDHVDITFDFPRRASPLLSGFAGHPLVVPAAAEWLQKHGRERHNPFALAHVAMLARTPESRAILLEDLMPGESVPQWPIHALLDISGPQDTEVREAVFALFNDPNRAASVANYLPRFIPDRIECRQRLLELLTTTQPFDAGHVLDGLKEMGDLCDPATVAILEKRLMNDTDGRFWSSTSSRLLEALPQEPLVRAAASAEFCGSDLTLSALAKAYADDTELRPHLEAMLEPLHEDLRLAVVRELRGFTLREDPFARDLLANYTREWDAETRTAAADAYYSALLKLGLQTEKHVAQLRRELMEARDISSTGRQAAAAGLLALNRPGEILKAALQRDPSLRALTLHANVGKNWELIRVLVEHWETMAEACGGEVWKLFGGWDVLVSELAKAGKRAASLTVPVEIADGARRHIEQDEEGFRALAVLEAGLPSMRELCIRLLSKFRITGSQLSHVSWGHNESAVLFEAAHYLVEHYGGDADLGRQLEELAKDSFEPIWSLVALCRGWPNSPVLDPIWARCSGSSSSDTVTAWLMTMKADPTAFAEYVLALPRALQSERWWRFPRETLRPLRERLGVDLSSQRLVAQGLELTSERDAVASVIRLLGMAMQDRDQLRDWARQILSVGGNSPLLNYGYDVLTGQVRPVPHCIMDGLLTR